jgi:hypothetical protein
MVIVKFLLGTDEPAFITAAAGAILALGITIFFHVVYFSPRPIHRFGRPSAPE